MRRSNTGQRGRLQDGLIRRASVLSEIANSGSLALGNEKEEEEDQRELDALDGLESEIDHADVEEFMVEVVGGTRLRFPD